MIKVTEFPEGRIMEAQNETDAKLLVNLSLALQKYDPDKPTKKALKKVKSAWLRVEHNLGHELPKTAGIERTEIFGCLK